MPTFTPLTHEEPMRTDVRPLNYFRETWADTLVRTAPGVYSTVRSPYVGTLVGTAGTDYFLGGHEYEVTNAQAIELEAAGYPVTNWALRDYFTNRLPNRDTQDVRIAVLGDSISEGTGAGDFTLTWRYLLQQSLRTAYPTTGVPTPGIGYVPALAVTGAPTPPVVTSGSPGTNFAENGLGVKRYRVNNTQYVEWTAQQCDRVRIWYGRHNFLAGNGTVAIDTVDQVTLTGTDSVISDGYVWDSGALTPGSHVVRVRGVSGFGFTLEACEFFNGDKGKGIHVYDAAHFGATVGTFISANTDTGHWMVFATLNPHVTIVNLGTNDIALVNPATFQANLTTMVSKIRAAAPNTTIVFVKGWRYPPRSEGVWGGFRAAVDAVSKATSNSMVYDLAANWPQLVADGSSSQGLMLEASNPLHPSPAGHVRYAELMSSLLIV